MEPAIPRVLSHSVYTLDDMCKLEKSTTGEETVTYLFPDYPILHSVFNKQDYREVEITGFEIYIVEQWTCERKYSTVITAFTGDSEHKVQCGQVKLLKDQTRWSPKMKFFFKEIEDYGAKLKETEHGYLFITNLSSMPSNLNLIPLAGGCIMNFYDCFKVNVNLKRLKCGGRSAMFLSPPSDASEDKFRQIYKTHPKVDLMYSVSELVTLVQICLVDFKLLDPLFVDGLLCNKTEEKITEWWMLYGTPYYGYTPKDGILGPSTVSAILGFVLSCHYRFYMASIDFPKEPFNYFSFRVIVGKFQKQYNLERTWYLDPATVQKLFRVTSKTSTSDISKLKKVVKSRVHDISGKQSSERCAQDVLTVDLERAIKFFACSPRLEFLWFGKGDYRDFKQFEYYAQMQASMMGASALKSGVGKIRNFPKRLQSEEYLISRPKTDKSDSKSETTSGDDDLLACKIEDKKLCKVVACDDEVCKYELTRRASYPFIRDELNVAQLEYENHCSDLHSRVQDNKVLKRSKSYSFIADAVFQWETDVSPMNIAHQLKRLEWQILMHKDVCDRFQEVRELYQAQRDRFHAKNAKLHQLVKPLVTRCEAQVGVEDRLHLKLADIRATGARLEYEMRLLGTRVRDAQDSVEQFETKVTRLEKTIRASENCKPWSQPISAERVQRIWGLLEQFGPVKGLRWVFGWS